MNMINFEQEVIEGTQKFLEKEDGPGIGKIGKDNIDIAIKVQKLGIDYLFAAISLDELYEYLTILNIHKYKEKALMRFISYYIDRMQKESKTRKTNEKEKA